MSEIEIPFGAFDSELIYEEITIPDGFEAVIKDKKIILKRKENEDERIRKAIHIYLDWLDGRKDCAPKGEYSIRNMIAWLEKQGESIKIKKGKNYLCTKTHKYAGVEWVKGTEYYASDNYTLVNKGCEYCCPKSSKKEHNNLFEEVKYYNYIEKKNDQSYTTLVETGNGGINALVTSELPANSCDDANYCSDCINKKGCINCEDGNMKETLAQKLVDKVESKFKVGDFIKHNKANIICKVISVNSSSYYVENVETSGKIELFNAEQNFHLWTIQDAKDGDVLNANGAPFIYKKHDKDCVYFYCGVNLAGEFVEANEFDTWSKNNKVYPATKEQHDFLFKKMKEAEYTFNFEKKELKKIVVPIFNIGDTIIKKHNSDINKFGSFKITDISGGKYWYNKIIICDITEQDEWEIYEPIRQTTVKLSKGEQNSVWSEEDEEMLDNAVYACLNIYGKDSDTVDWLKSLKDRVQPQPKKEWNEDDEHRAEDTIYFLNTAKAHYASTVEIEACVDWLKSLKKRLRE